MKKFNLILCKVFIILIAILVFIAAVLIITSTVYFLTNFIKYNGNVDFIVYNHWIIDFLDIGFIIVILSTINLQILKMVLGNERKC